VPRKKKSEEEELEDLVEDLDELEDDDFEEDEEDEDDEEFEDDEDEDEDEDPDEAPRKSRRSKSKKAAPKKKVGVGTTELAEATGVNARSIRMFLRAKEVQPRDDREGRYSWKSVNDPEFKRLVKEIKAGGAAKVNEEKLADLKSRKKGRKKTTAKKTTAKKSTTRKRRAKAKA